jgi:hypothetical protein
MITPSLPRLRWSGLTELPFFSDNDQDKWTGEFLSKE